MFTIFDGMGPVMRREVSPCLVRCAALPCGVRAVVRRVLFLQFLSSLTRCFTVLGVAPEAYPPFRLVLAATTPHSRLRFGCSTYVNVCFAILGSFRVASYSLSRSRYLCMLFPCRLFEL